MVKDMAAISMQSNKENYIF